MAATEVYRFDAFVLDVGQRQLSNGAGVVTLAPKAFDLLVALVRHGGRLVTKEQLLAEVWPEASVEEGILAVHVSALRKALGDVPQSPRFIQTVARTGYRFVGRLEEPGQSSSSPRIDTPTAVRHPSIAVLPLVNLGDDASNGYFSDGLTEEIIGTLTQIIGLRVISRTTAFAYRGGGDLRKIGADLGVDTILEGSVRTAGNRIRVSVQLVDPVTGLHLWSQRYDRELSDVFAVQDDIAGSIAATLELALGEGLATPAPRPPLAAYEAYLKALHFRRIYGPDALERCREWFEKALELAPEYVPAHVGLAACYISMATEGTRASHDAMPLARAAAQHALALDGNNPDAHAVLGTIALLFDYDAAAVEEAWRHVGIRPHSYVAVWFGGGYLSTRQGQRAHIDLLARALEIDPLNHLFRSIQAFCYVFLGELDKAMRVARRCIELDENAPGGHFVIAMVQAERGKWGDALAAAQRAYHLMPTHPRSVGLLAATLERTGDRLAAAPLIASLRDSTAPGAAMGMIQYHLVAGDVENAIPWFERAVASREPLVNVYTSSPKMQPFRTNPRFSAVLHTFNLPSSTAALP